MKRRPSPLRTNSRSSTSSLLSNYSYNGSNGRSHLSSSSSRVHTQRARTSGGTRRSAESSTSAVSLTSSGGGGSGNSNGLETTTASSNSTWIKNHPLEGDGVLIKFYHYLYKKNKEMNSCPVRIPQTIVYEHNFPRDWFTYDEKTQELRKTSGKELDTKKIGVELTRPVDRNDDDIILPERDEREPTNSASASSGYHLLGFNGNNQDEEEDFGNAEIVASYLSQTEDEDGQVAATIEFFDQQGLDEFLYKRARREHGILQQFIPPKGAHNSTVQAIWSPHVIRIERRNNSHKLMDTRRKQKISNYERAVTYEGPTHYSTQVLCAPQLKKEVSEICESIVRHFYETEHRRITRMVLYFKVDAQNRVWLLWSSCVRVKPNVPGHGSIPKELNLAPRFLPPPTEANNQSLDQSAKPQWRKSTNTTKLEDTTSFEPFRSETPATPNMCSICGLPLKNRRTFSPLVKHSVPEIEITAAPQEKKPAPPEIPDTEEIKSLLMLVEEIEDLSYECNSHFLDDPSDFVFKIPLNIQEELDNKNILIEHYWSYLKKKLRAVEVQNSTSYLCLLPTNSFKYQKAFQKVLDKLKEQIAEKRKELIPPPVPEDNNTDFIPELKSSQPPVLSPAQRTMKRRQGRLLCELCASSSPTAMRRSSSRMFTPSDSHDSMDSRSPTSSTFTEFPSINKRLSH